MNTATAVKSKAKKTTAPFSAPIAEVHLVPIELIDVIDQVRTEFEPESIKELAEDIEMRGLMQPVLLNPNGGRFTMIAGERRLRAIKLNGQTAIPALLSKASADEALLMQLAENVQREELSFEDECRAIAKLYEILGSLKVVAAKVKKSVPWCSKRYAVTQSKLDHRARGLMEDGTTEDIELLKAASSLFEILNNWQTSAEWCNKIRKGEAGRNEIRAALKEAKEVKKANDAKAKVKLEKLSHAKPKEPPPTPEWNLDDALAELMDTLLYADAYMSAIELKKTWTDEQQQEVKDCLERHAKEGTFSGAFQLITKGIIDGVHSLKMSQIEFLAVINGYSGQQFDFNGFLANLQTTRE